MKHILSRVFLSALLTIAVWYFFLLAVGYVASFGDAWLNEGRIWPYSHAHLGEEYAEGNYLPALDPLFLTSAAVRNGLAFAWGAALLALASYRLPVFFAHFALSIVIIYALQFGFRSPYMLQALAIETAFALIGASVGTYIGKTLRHRTSP